MSQELILKIAGLKTNANQLSLVPEGALAQAKNISIDKAGVAESVRGFMRLTGAPASDLIRNDRITSYQDKPIVRRSSNNTMAYYDAGSWTDYSGTYEHPDSSLARMQFAQSKGNLYFSTSEGVKVLDVYSGPIYSTGMPRGLDGVAALSGASGFMSDDTQVAYRIVWGSRDTNNNLYIGTPSQRIIVANAAGGTRDVALTFTIPAGISTADFFQVYRSKESASATDEPNDELQLVYEKNPTAGEITAKAVTFTDSTPTSLMGASLYTNASQEGIAESNDEPPFAKDICEYKNFMFFSGVQTKHKISIKLLSAGGSGLVNDDTITINSMVFTGKASETIASAEFKVSTGGSAAQNISDTAQSLVKVINQYASNTTVYAYYVSGFQDLPGQILLMKRTLGGSSFPVAVSRATAWDIGTGTSSNDDFPNGLMWAKNQQPEHVPTAHIEFVGSKNYPIRRILALRDSLFILKGDGVWRLTGSGGSWKIDPLDTSTKIIAPDSAAVVNNQVFCLADQGIVAISDVGVQIMSIDIEDQIKDIISESLANVKSLSFGMSYDTDRKYYLWTIADDSDSFPTRAFVYNTITEAWTHRFKDAKHAFVNPADDKVYLCNPEDKHILQERKTLTFTDYIDEEKDGYVVVSSTSFSVVMNTVAGLTEGDLLYESASVYSVITEIDAPTNTVTVNDVRTWTPGAITVNKVIECVLEFTAEDDKNPGIMKHFQECAMFFRETNFLTGLVSFFTDLSGGYSNTIISGNFGSDFFGLFPWGSIPWGGASRPKPIRCFVTRDKSRGTLISVKLTIANGYSKWSLNGMKIDYEWVSERSTRS